MLIFCAVLTSFGSSLTALGSFIAIGRIFQDIGLVALALAVKTLSSVILSSQCRKIVLKIGVYRTLMLSQVLGAPILLLLGASIYFKSLPLLIAGIFISGVTGNFLNLVLPPIIKEMVIEDDQFKKWQGMYQMLVGIGSLIAALSVPVILDEFSIYGLYFLDLGTFVLAAGLFYANKNWYRAQFKFEDQEKVSVNYFKMLRNVDGAEFRALLFIIPSFIFTGLIPVIASSGISQNFGHASGLIERLWFAESFASIVIGWLYYRINFLRNSRWITFVPLFCTAPLLAIYINKSASVFYLSFLIYAILYFYGFNRYRDDLIIAAKNLNQRLVYSELHLVVINLLRTISAPIVAFLISKEMIWIAAGAPIRLLIGVQVGLGVLAICTLIILNKKSSHAN
jgi:hypothetical protein